MADKFVKTVLAAVSAIICWLLLSYLFFPIKLSAPPQVYFAETVTHMIPLKAVITSVFVLLAVFIYEKRAKRKRNKKIDTVLKTVDK